MRTAAALLILAVSAGLSADPAPLDTFRLEIAPAHLDSLVETPERGERYPGVVEWSADRCSCQVGLRGGSTMYLPKKNFQLELSEPSVEGWSEILLNAELRDTTLMRNCLGLMLTRLQGRPASFARHAWLRINGEEYGLYLQVEDIDQHFLNRFSLGSGPIFKSENHPARLALFPCHEDPLEYWEPRMDCGHQGWMLEELAQRVCLGGTMDVDTMSFLDYAAASIAIRDGDSMTKNLFAIRAPDGLWRFVPWDRDATFGNTWWGAWAPGRVREVFFQHLSYTPLLQRFLETDQGAWLMAQRLEVTADLMEDGLTPAADSIYQRIRPYALADPWLQISPDAYDSLCDSLFGFLERRPQILREGADDLVFSPVESLQVTPCRLEDGDDFSVLMESVHPLDFAQLHFMDPEAAWAETGFSSQGPGDTLWEAGGQLPDTCYAWAMTAYTASSLSGDSACLGTYPGYGFANYGWQRTAHPSVVRALGPLEADLLQPQDPVRCGPALWYLPVVNASDEAQDLSRCGFRLEEAAAGVYLPDSFLLPAGDTLLLTNDAEALQMEVPSTPVAGNLQTESPSGYGLELLNPGWSVLRRYRVGEEDTLPAPQSRLVITEVCTTPAAESGDWIELYNRSADGLDLSAYVLTDNQNRSSVIPGGTEVPAWGFLVLCRSGEDFEEVFPSIPGQVVACLESGLRRSADSVTLRDRIGRVAASLTWDGDEGWPCGSNSVMALASDTREYRQVENWTAARLPGSPGEANPSWSLGLDLPVLMPLRPCPARLSSVSRVLAGFAVDRLPAQLRVYSVDGRLVAGPVGVNGYEGTASLSLEGWNRPGVYLVSLTSNGRTVVRKMVVIP
ncbi:MAG: CotH kinase family protein [Candidatus Fermentibacteraceae bacterium]